MRDMSSSRWQNKGSSVICDRLTLSELLTNSGLVSLRVALGWLTSKSWPVEPPGNGKTLLVGGLETCLDVLTPEEAEHLLRHRVKPLILEVQHCWDQCGLVFGFSASRNSFEISAANEEVLFIRRDRKPVRLSYALWDGSSTLNLTRLLRGQDTIGYHVQRIS